MAAFAEVPRKRGRWFIAFSVLALALAMTTGAALWHAMSLSSMPTMQAAVERLGPVLTGWRWAAIGLVGLLWPTVTRWLHRAGRLDEAEQARVLALRWRIVAWLIVIELMLGQALPVRFLAALRGAFQ